MPSSKPHPPVVGKVTHHSIELYWDLEKKEKRQGPQEQWHRFSIEEEDPKTHTYGIIYTGYATKHVIEGLEPRTLYRFRLKVTSPSGECEYSPVISVSTTREPISSEHFHRAVNVNDEDLLVQILEGGHVKVDVPNKFGFTALMVAAQKGYTRLVKILVSNGTDVNLKNGSGKDRPWLRALPQICVPLSALSLHLSPSLFTENPWCSTEVAKDTASKIQPQNFPEVSIWTGRGQYRKSSWKECDACKGESYACVLRGTPGCCEIPPQTWSLLGG
uniref:fibronectin type 3 and ankyrin repeat domains protein 1 isoform X4 n=1 Tax=Ictidomys tridecemlineatus TaxID=43179 RepID=UPI001A9D1E08|nr:fibronectin type 3 and ankyrin repeat domains protein 1 isoform X4 [Ictidomys tridecemlineatus]